jgi:flagellar P-ring protein precursor FlgI
VDEMVGNLTTLKKSPTVADVAAALNALGVRPRDLLAILQALRAAGALRAELVVL